MKNLKKGDKVIYQKPGNTKHGNIGIITNVGRNDDSFYKVKRDGDSRELDWFCHRTFLFSDIFASKAAGAENEWEFPVQSLLAIDWDTLMADLKMQTPIQLITVTSDKVQTQMIAVHFSLLRKAELVGIATPNLPVRGYDALFSCPNHFSEWADWAKKVKAANWPEGGVKATVHIKQISL